MYLSKGFVMRTAFAHLANGLSRFVRVRDASIDTYPESAKRRLRQSQICGAIDGIACCPDKECLTFEPVRVRNEVQL